MKIIKAVINAHLVEFYWEWGNEPIGYVSIGRWKDDESLKVMGYMPKEWLSYPGLRHIKFNCPYN